MTRAQVDEFNASLDELQRQAEGYQRALLRAYMDDNPSASVAEVREFCIAAIDDALGVYAGPASELAAAMFEWVCEGEGIDASASMPDEPIDRAAMVEKVHYEAGRLRDGDREGFAKQTGALTAFYVRRCAFETTALSCKDADVRFARVPTGKETCGWCFMLSSRGWDYRSEQTASAGSHRGCDCVMVPGVNGQTIVEGYDPGALYLRYKMCSDAVDVESFKRRTDAEWDAMGEEARAKWRTAATGAVLTDEERERLGITGDAAAKSRFAQHRWTSAITAEIETRDWDWLWTGKAPAIKKDGVSNKEWKRKPEYERKGYEALAGDFGFDVVVLPEDSSIANIDMRIGGTLWELKTITGSGDRIWSRIGDGISKWKRLHAAGEELSSTPKIVIDARYTSMPDDDVIETLREAQERFSALGFNEAAVIKKDGAFLRVKTQ